MKIRHFALTGLLAGLAASPAWAITNADVLKMPSHEGYAYVAATVEMTAFLAEVNGDRDRAQCIVNWYFRTEKTQDNVLQAMDHFSDRTPQAVIYALINRKCGKPG